MKEESYSYMVFRYVLMLFMLCCTIAFVFTKCIDKSDEGCLTNHHRFAKNNNAQGFRHLIALFLHRLCA